mmetsp:Transcript_5094/g.13120  ORF Transcript_5094/g.13120 Transcript_5094/m.13120 type:complete len:391 (-) Transcript_5094:96-1268(-)
MHGHRRARLRPVIRLAMLPVHRILRGRVSQRLRPLLPRALNLRSRPLHFLVLRPVSPIPPTPRRSAPISHKLPAIAPANRPLPTPAALIVQRKMRNRTRCIAVHLDALILHLPTLSLVRSPLIDRLIQREVSHHRYLHPQRGVHRLGTPCTLLPTTSLLPVNTVPRLVIRRTVPLNFPLIPRHILDRPQRRDVKPFPSPSVQFFPTLQNDPRNHLRVRGRIHLRRGCDCRPKPGRRVEAFLEGGCFLRSLLGGCGGIDGERGKVLGMWGSRRQSRKVCGMWQGRGRGGEVRRVGGVAESVRVVEVGNGVGGLLKGKLLWGVSGGGVEGGLRPRGVTLARLRADVRARRAADLLPLRRRPRPLRVLVLRRRGLSRGVPCGRPRRGRILRAP